MAISFSNTDLVIWASTFSAELVTVGAIRRSDSSALNAPLLLYVALQASISGAMYILSLFSSQDAYVNAYAGGTLLTYGAELGIMVVLYRMLAGKSKGFGSLLAWVVATGLLSILVLAFGSLSHPVATSRCLSIIYSLRQVGGVVRTLGLISLALYGFITASSWGARSGRVWLGLALNVGSEFMCTALALRFPLWEPALRYGPDLFFGIALYLWSTKDAVQTSAYTSSLASLTREETGR